MFLQTVFGLSVVALEVPSGYFSDVYGRRYSLALTGVFMTLSIAAFSVGYSFTHFIVAEVLYAAALTFTSGASSALIYDTLKDSGREKDYKRVVGSVRFYTMVSLAVSAILGGILGGMNLRYPFYATLPFAAAMISVALSMSEPARHSESAKSGLAPGLFKIVRRALVEDKRVRWLIVYLAVLHASIQSGFWLWQPYFILSGIGIASIGVIYAGFNLFSGVCSKYAHKIELKLGGREMLMTFPLLLALAYFLTSRFVFAYSFMFILLIQFVRGTYSIVGSDILNKLTSSDSRATVLSLQSLVSRLLYASVVPFVGYAADVFSLTQALSILGAMTLIAGGMFLAVLKKEKVI